MRKVNTKQVFFLILAITIAIVMLFPLFWLITGAFKPPGYIFSYPPQFIPESFTLENLYDLFALDNPFYIYFFNSSIVSLFHVIGTLLFSSMAGYALAKYEFKGKKLIFAIIISGMLIPFQALIIPLFLISKNLGLLDSRIALVIPFIANPMGAFLMRQYMASIPDSLIDSARIDGAREFRIFWQIICPIVKPAFAALAIIDFVVVWNGFVWTLIIMRTQSKFTLPVWLNALLQDPYISNNGLMFMAGFLSVLPVIIVFLFLQKYFISGLVTGAED